MTSEQLLPTEGTSGLETHAEFTRWMRRIVKGSAELRAFEAGQIDAIMDPATVSAILLPAARSAPQNPHQLALEVLDALPGGACVLDSLGTVLMTNRAWRAFAATHSGVGLSVRQGASFIAAYRDAPPEKPPHAGAMAAGFRQVMSGASPRFRREFVCRGRNGHCAFTLTIARITSDGDVHALVTRENIRTHKPTGTVRRIGSAKADRISTEARTATSNRLLNVLPDEEFQRLLVGFEPVNLAYGQVLYEPGDQIEFVYFPNDCPVSLLTVVEGHRSLEVGLVGREGIVGSRLALGGTTSSDRALVQGSGTAVRMKSAHFLRELRRSPGLQRVLLRFIDTLLIQVTANAACNRFHLVGERLARWLLMTRERSPSRKFYLTHDFLANMLGTRRESVTEAASTLKLLHLIDYNRGTITILDQPGLEAASCSCYQRVKVAGLDALAG